LCDLPAEERPRERLYHVGERALSTTELLAIVIGSGHGNDNVLKLAQLLLELSPNSWTHTRDTHQITPLDRTISRIACNMIFANYNFLPISSPAVNDN
jgi:hypothetical protein